MWKIIITPIRGHRLKRFVANYGRLWLISLDAVKLQHWFLHCKHFRLIDLNRAFDHKSMLLKDFDPLTQLKLHTVHLSAILWKFFSWRLTKGSGTLLVRLYKGAGICAYECSLRGRPLRPKKINFVFRVTFWKKNLVELYKGTVGWFLEWRIYHEAGTPAYECSLTMVLC